jgi:hypothetical protein
MTAFSAITSGNSIWPARSESLTDNAGQLILMEMYGHWDSQFHGSSALMGQARAPQGRARLSALHINKWMLFLQVLASLIGILEFRRENRKST